MEKNTLSKFQKYKFEKNVEKIKKVNFWNAQGPVCQVYTSAGKLFDCGSAKKCHRIRNSTNGQAKKFYLRSQMYKSTVCKYFCRKDRPSEMCRCQ